MSIAGLAGQRFSPVYSRRAWLDRYVARRTAGVKSDESFKFLIEPRSPGSIESAQRLLAGEYPVPGSFPEVSDGGIWKTRVTDPEQLAWMHGFTWLDDFAALRDADSIALARNWVFGWLDMFGSGRGPGWRPEVAARRLIRLVHNAYVVLAMRREAERASFARTVAHHAEFLGRRFWSISRSSERIEALTALLYAQISLERGKDDIARTAAKIAEECKRSVDDEGTLTSRSPEELLQVATLLNWAGAALVDAGIQPRLEHTETQKRSGLVLRTLRHLNGELARFHGGGSGNPAQLLQVIAKAGRQDSYFKKTVMGFARLSSERTSVIVDVAPPVTGWGSKSSHASTLAFELVTAKCPIVVNCGSGKGFASGFERESRETRAHSTVEVNGTSSSRFAERRRFGRGEEEIVVYAPKETRIVQLPDATGNTFAAEHDGYASLYGLTHLRRLDLGTDGRSLWGEDTLWAKTNEHTAAFERAAGSLQDGAIPFVVRFHLHPDTTVELYREEQFANLFLPTGETWMFEYEGAAYFDLEHSAYFDTVDRVAYATQQIVLSSHVATGSAQLRWIFEASPG